MKSLPHLPQWASTVAARVTVAGRSRLPFADGWFKCLCGRARFYLWHGSMMCQGCKTYYLFSPDSMTLHRYRCLRCLGRVFYRSRSGMMCAKCLATSSLRELIFAHVVLPVETIEELKKKGALMADGTRAPELPSAGGNARYDALKAQLGMEPGIDNRRVNGPKKKRLDTIPHI